MRPLIVSAFAALQIVLDERARYQHKEIIGILEDDPVMRKSEEPMSWTAAVKTHDDEWSLFSIRAASKEEETDYNETKVPSSDQDECDLIITEVTNALSHAEALLDCMGHATNIL